jgi:DNA-binding Lrp family transcriptional regulator
MVEQLALNFDADDICQNNHGGNPESFGAHRTTDKSKDRRKILEILERAGELGATCDYMEQRLDISHQTCSARCSELIRDGVIARKHLSSKPGDYLKRPTRTGRMAAVLIYNGMPLCHLEDV